MIKHTKRRSSKSRSRTSINKFNKKTNAHCSSLKSQLWAICYKDEKKKSTAWWQILIKTLVVLLMFSYVIWFSYDLMNFYLQIVKRSMDFVYKKISSKSSFILKVSSIFNGFISRVHCSILYNIQWVQIFFLNFMIADCHFNTICYQKL